MGIHARTGQARVSITEADVQRALVFLEHAIASFRAVKPEWMTRAACRGVDTAVFFPHRGEHTDALTYCNKCVVADQCREFVRSFDGRTPGIWGGENEHRRREQYDAQLASTRVMS